MGYLDTERKRLNEETDTSINDRIQKGARGLQRALRSALMEFQVKDELKDLEPILDSFIEEADEEGAIEIPQGPQGPNTLNMNEKYYKELMQKGCRLGIFKPHGATRIMMSASVVDPLLLKVLARIVINEFEDAKAEVDRS